MIAQRTLAILVEENASQRSSIQVRADSKPALNDASALRGACISESQ